MLSDNQSRSMKLQRNTGCSVARVLWLLPVIFIIHDGEELLTMPSWIASHQRELDHLARISETVAEMVHSPPTTTQLAAAMGFFLLLFVVATVGATLSGKRGFWLYAYAALLGALFLHAFTHVAQAIFVGGYVRD